ncbi:MAG TPA: hydroxyethylthiazole kinase [Kiritimatiellia bacterium]|nr:hydroxyethylthiazole kinase [Kiritimatiellia bacterium]HPS08627.1 hydroxyethylthiazole kinase [Kiritimatiellia bacterium]
MSTPSQIAEIAHLLSDVRVKKPLVHNLTNYVTVNDCANALLAVGASPVMADDPDDVRDIAALADAVVINIGTLNARTIPSMFAAGKIAAARGRPVILDPVGAGASRRRTGTALELMREIPFAVIRGNVSEIKTLLGGSGATRGVDASDGDLSADGLAGTAAAAKALADRTGAIVAVTGATDILTDGVQTLAVNNGHPLMSRITGSGCMLSAVTGAFCGAAQGRMLMAVAAALCTLGLAGEQAAARTLKEKAGTGSFRTYLIDCLSLMDEATLAGGMKIELFA